MWKRFCLGPCTYNCENGKYLASIMRGSAIMWDKAIEPYENKTNFNEKKATYKTRSFYMLFSFLLITIGLLITVSIYCYLIKYLAMQKCLL